MKKLALLTLALAMLLALPTLAHADALPEFSFDAAAGRITAYNGPGGEVALPAEIDGARVWDVGGAIFQNNGAVTALALPEGMDVMSDNLTSQLPNLASVTLPESLRVICRGNFQLCDSLTEVTLPAGVSYIADNCFSWCQQLRRVTFTGVCPRIADSTFSVLAEDCVVYVPDDQFDAYRAAIPEEIEVASSGVNAERVAFATPEDQFAFDPETGTVTGYVDRAARMDIPAEIGGVPVKAIGEGAFTPAYHLMYLTVPEGVEVIGAGAFAHTNSILGVELPDSVRDVGDEAFLGAIRGNRFHWPASLERIGNKAFYNCYFTDEIDLPASLASIGDEAFSWTWAQSMHLPEGCRPWIGSRAFADGHLDYMQMDTYDFFEMAPDAFAGSPLSSVDLPWDSGWDNRLAWQGYMDSQLEGCTVYINNPPDCSYEQSGVYEKGEDGYFYLATIGGEEEAPYLYYNIWDNSGEERVLVECRGVADGVFKGNQAIRRFRVTHANWPWHIGAEAFADSSVELVDLFYTTETIGERAFANCKNLTEITLPASLTRIGEGAFDGCDSLTRVNIACDPDILPENAFANCAALVADPSGIALPATASDEAVARLSREMGCPWYAPLLRPGDTPMTIVPMPYAPTDPSLFEFDAETGTITGYLGGEADVVVPREIDGVAVTSIGYTAFDRCRDYTDTGMITNQTDWTRLRSVVLPETVTHIDDSVFNYCQQLETFICYGPVESTGKGTFSLARNLKTAVFVNGVKVIDNYCFQDTDCFETFYSAVPLDRIGESAFLNSGVTRFVVDATTLGNCVFRNCPNLTELHFTDRVRATDGAVAFDCPALEQACFEGHDMEAFSRDGCIANCSDWLRVFVPEDADQAMKDRAQSCITWETHCLVAVKPLGCDRAPEAMPDLDGILAGYAANPLATPEPVATPEPIVAEPVGEAGEPFLGTWALSQVVIGDEAYAAADIGMDKMRFTLNADGTFEMPGEDGESQAGAWKVSDGSALLIDMVFSFAEDGRLVGEVEGAQMVFEKVE